jgi:hypothetical protein
MTLPAGRTGAAGKEAEDDMIALLHLPHMFPDRLDNAGSFMAQNDRLRHGIDLIARHHIGVAHAGRYNPHQYFVMTGRRNVHRLNPERAALLTNDSGPKGFFSQQRNRHLARSLESKASSLQDGDGSEATLLCIFVKITAGERVIDGSDVLVAPGRAQEKGGQAAFLV